MAAVLRRKLFLSGVALFDQVGAQSAMRKWRHFSVSDQVVDRHLTADQIDGRSYPAACRADSTAAIGM